MENISIAGSGTVAGGMDYGKISIAGSGTVASAVRCEEFSCSGSGHARGDVDCTGIIRTAGSFRCDGTVCAAELKSAGTLRAAGDLQVKKISSAGSVYVDGSVHGEEVRTVGALHVGGDLEAESAILRGAVNIGGLLNAEHIELHPEHVDSFIGTIGGSTIRVIRHTVEEKLPSWRKLFRRASGASGIVHTDVIEGDEVELENTEANTVRGRVVRLGTGTKIGRVEFSESYTAENGASVGETVKAE